MRSYHAYLVARANRIFGDLKAVALPRDQTVQLLEQLTALLQEIQANKRNSFIANPAFWDDYQRHT
jgi:hypothetical protein